MVYEMRVGLSQAAAASQATGLPAGGDHPHGARRHDRQGHTGSRRGGSTTPRYEARRRSGRWLDRLRRRPVLGRHRTSGRPRRGRAGRWSPLNYQTVTRHYIEALRDGNYTDHWGETLYRLWLVTNKCAPIEIASAEMSIP